MFRFDISEKKWLATWPVGVLSVAIYGGPEAVIRRQHWAGFEHTFKMLANTHIFNLCLKEMLQRKIDKITKEKWNGRSCIIIFSPGLWLLHCVRTWLSKTYWCLWVRNNCEWEMYASGKFLQVGNIFWNVQVFGVLVQMLVRWLSKQNQRSDANSLQIFSFLAVWMFWMHKKRAGQQVIINSAIVLICCSLNVLRKKGECQQIIIKQTTAASHCIAVESTTTATAAATTITTTTNSLYSWNIFKQKQQEQH